MPWNLQEIQHRVFARNPLALVIAQVRFHPILQVPNRIADFQELVRGRFPLYQQRVAHNIEIRDVAAGVRVQQEPQFVFQAPEDARTLFVSTGALGLETRNHTDRESFQGDVRVALDALRRVFGDFAPTRVGLRYVNTIQREQIGRDLGRSVSWEDLVTDGFLRVPGGPTLGPDTRFSGEVTSDVVTGGRLTLRYGLIAAPGGPDEFRLDLDRYMDQGIDAASLEALLDVFADDIFSLFISSVGPALAEWMSGGQE